MYIGLQVGFQCVRTILLCFVSTSRRSTTFAWHCSEDTFPNTFYITRFRQWGRCDSYWTNGALRRRWKGDLWRGQSTTHSVHFLLHAHTHTHTMQVGKHWGDLTFLPNSLTHHLSFLKVFLSRASVPQTGHWHSSMCRLRLLCNQLEAS